MCQQVAKRNMKAEFISESLGKKFNQSFKAFVNNPDEEIVSLLTDSRNHFTPEGTMFFAINTPGGNDGHKFLTDLFNRGVRNFVVENIPEDFPKDSDANIFIVPDSVMALSEIARCNRKNAKELLAITGSRGKTTLKELIFQLMEPLKKISRSPRSFNSRIGVPLSMWNIAPDSDLAIIEAGISKKGEMQNLLDIILPDTVILTNIGDAHSYGFSSYKEKATEKSILAAGPSVKTVIYPKDDQELDGVLTSLASDKKLIRWSITDPSADLYLSSVENGLEYVWNNERHSLNISLGKDYDLNNIANALAFMLKEGIDPEIIKERFQNLRKINTRLNVSEGVNRCSVVLDSYTSDLSSLLPAIDFIKRRKMPFQTMTLIISDLHYEGKDAGATYKEIAKLVAETKIDKFIGVGKNLMKHSDKFPENSEFYPDTETYLKKFSLNDFYEEIILLKGDPSYDFDQISQQLEAKRHETVLEVNLDALLRNYNYFRHHVPSSVGVIAMVKASGYGAGSYEIAKTLQDAGASYLAVAALDEGAELRNNGIVMPIMVMNPKSANYRSLFKNRLEPVVYSFEMLSTLIKESHRYGVGEYPVHIKLDTGMHRMGFLKEELPEVVKLIRQVDNIRIATIFSHLATADCLDMDDFTMLQLRRFEEMSDIIIKGAGYSIKRHILNSAGILRFPEFHYDFVRLGIGLYGANTLPPEVEKPLDPVSSLRSVIICIRNVKEDETVGYGRKGKVKGVRKIATLPIGYADGMNRKFGNGAIKVLVNGVKVPTIGNICMDATMIDVTDVDCKVGDSVEIFGRNISVSALADTLETIPYEVLTSVSPRVKRMYYRE